MNQSFRVIGSAQQGVRRVLCGALLFVSLSSVEFAFADEVPDPFENLNRGIFAVNDSLDTAVLEPVARKYDAYVPEPVQIGIGNFFNNLRFPRYLVSDLIQLKFEQSLHHTGRFLINSTIGLVGFIDVAKHLGLEDHEEDIGSALGYHGVGTGPYMVLPLLGPSNLRDTIGTVFDFALDPLYFTGAVTNRFDMPFAVSAGTTTVKYVDRRAGLLEAVDAAKESSLDYYLFVRSAYQQHRQGVIHDGMAPEGDDIFDE